MKKQKRQPSNVFAIPKWMQNLRAAEPAGNMTPDQAGSTMELCMLLHDSDAVKLRACISSLVPKVPLKNQRVLKAFIACTDSNMLDEVRAFISQVNQKLAELTQVMPDGKVEEPPPSGDGPVVDDWRETDDSGFVQGKRSSRGNRAIRAAKRQQVDA